MNTKMMMVALVAAVVLAASAAILLTNGEDDTKREYTITYVLNGGDSIGSNPSTYTQGTEVKLSAATDDEMIFDSWYLDADLETRCDTITADMSGDMILYAGWTESLVGKGMIFSVEGYHSSGVMNSYTIDGTVSYEYLYMDEDGRYLMGMSMGVTYSYLMTAHTVSDEDTYWSGESDTQWTFEGTEVIDTVNGEKECEVYKGLHSDGSSETQWIGDGWIVYRIEYRSIGTYSSTVSTYSLIETYSFEPDSSVDVSVSTDIGISVSGAGTYRPGDTVTLVAIAEDGKAFSGWYDTGGSLLSTSSTYTFEVGYGDYKIRAMNTDDPDFLLQTGGTLSGLEFTSDTTWTVTGTGEEASFTGDPSQHPFDEPGSYTVTSSDPDGMSLVFTVYVDGTKVVEYEWESDGRSYTYSIGILYSDLEYYRDLYDVSQRQQDLTGNHQRDATFVTYQDRYIQKIAADFSSMTEGLTSLEKVTLVLDFVQSVGYQDDQVYMGYEEYWKFPLETLYDHGGDCEDTSILMSAIVKAMGFDTSLLILPGHMAAGVSVEGCTGAYYLSQQSGKRYYYCETTADGYAVGELPSEIDGYRATLVEI